MFDGMPDEFLPQALIDEPLLWDENAETLNAFYRLNGTRQHGMNGAFAISLSEMLAYCQMFEIDDVPQFFNAISACDAVFFAHMKTLEK